MNAADMTHKLSEIGNGDMHDGILATVALTAFATSFVCFGIGVSAEVMRVARKKIKKCLYPSHEAKNQESLADSQIDDLRSSERSPQKQAKHNAESEPKV